MVDICTKFLPGDVNLETEGPYNIKPNFDVDMNLLGYYDEPNRGGDLKELTYLGDDPVTKEPIYRDDRPVRKYYQADKNKKFLNAFVPEFNLPE